MVVNTTLSLQVEVINNSIDLCALTEIWLKQEDNTTSAVICPNGYKAINIPTPNRMGGGIAIIHQKELNVSHVKTYKFDTMESADFKISATEADKHLTLIYGPPDINVLTFIND